MGRRDRQEQRYRLLFERHWRRVTGYVERRCPDRTAVEDVVSEVFLVAWRRIDEVPADDELPWLFGVARRTLANSRRSNVRRQRLIERLHYTNSGQAVDAADGPDGESDPAERIHAALARLRPVDAEILRLAAWEELTPTQIAVVMRCSPNAAAVRLHRARRRLSDALEATTDVKESGPYGHEKVTAGPQPQTEPPR